MKKESKKSSGENYFHGKSIASVDAVPGINTPGIELPAFNPPVPNRAWTSMREELSRDNINPADHE